MPGSVPSNVTRVVMDNGGHTCKVGFAGERKPVKCILNGIAKTKGHKVYVADQLEKCNDFSSLQYRLSLERGCLVNWDTQAPMPPSHHSLPPSCSPLTRLTSHRVMNPSTGTRRRCGVGH